MAYYSKLYIVQVALRLGFGRGIEAKRDLHHDDCVSMSSNANNEKLLQH